MRERHCHINISDFLTVILVQVPCAIRKLPSARTPKTNWEISQNAIRLHELVNYLSFVYDWHHFHLIYLLQKIFCVKGLTKV